MHKFVMVLEMVTFSQGMNRYISHCFLKKNLILLPHPPKIKKKKFRNYLFALFVSPNRCMSKKFFF